MPADSVTFPASTRPRGSVPGGTRGGWLAALMATAAPSIFGAAPAAAAPVEYVRVCSAYGAGFFYIPGTDTCGYAGNIPGRTQTAYGTVSTQSGNGAVGYGTSSFANGDNTLAIGDHAFSGGDPFSASPGPLNSIDGQAPVSSFANTNTTAVGQGSQAGASDPGQNNATALGASAIANVANGTALGQGAIASGVGDVALGQGSTTAGASPTAGAAVPLVGGGVLRVTGFAGANPASVVSVGGGTNPDGTPVVRQVTNVAAGRISATSTDAVNGSQLYALASQVGALRASGAGPAAFASDNTGTNAAPAATGADATAGGYGATAGAGQSTAVGNRSNAAGGNSSAYGYAAVASSAGGTALGAGNTAIGSNSTAVGAGNVVTGANSGAFGTGNTVNGDGSYALGDPNVVNGNATAVVGNNNTVNGPAVAGNGDNVNVLGSGNAVASTASANGALVAGNGSTVNAVNAVAVGNGVNVTGADAVAVGQGSSATLGNSVALGAGSATTGASSVAGNAAAGVQYNAAAVAAGSGNVVSVGTAGAARQVQNVAAGAVTQTSTDAVNGSQLYAVAGNVTTLGTTTAAAIGGGTAYSSATGLSGTRYTLNGSNAAYTDVVSGQQALANGGAGPIQYSTPGTPSNALSLVGTGGAVTLSNVAAGTVNPNSLQAVNGSQLYGASRSVATALGGGSAVNRDGTVSAPSYQVGSNTYNDVGSALGALQNNTQAGLANLQNSLSNLQGKVDRGLKRANGGVAAAMALSSPSLPSAPGRLTYVANGATFVGEFGFGGAVAYRLDTNAPLAVTAGVGGSGRGDLGARIGIMGEL